MSAIVERKEFHGRNTNMSKRASKHAVSDAWRSDADYAKSSNKTKVTTVEKKRDTHKEYYMEGEESLADMDVMLPATKDTETLAISVDVPFLVNSDYRESLKIYTTNCIPDEVLVKQNIEKHWCGSILEASTIEEGLEGFVVFFTNRTVINIVAPADKIHLTQPAVMKFLQWIMYNVAGVKKVKTIVYRMFRTMMNMSVLKYCRETIAKQWEVEASDVPVESILKLLNKLENEEVADLCFGTGLYKTETPRTSGMLLDDVILESYSVEDVVKCCPVEEMCVDFKKRDVWAGVDIEAIAECYKVMLPRLVRFIKDTKRYMISSADKVDMKKVQIIEQTISKPKNVTTLSS